MVLKRASEVQSDPLMSPPEVSERLGVPDSTLRYWRHLGEGPEYMKVGRRVRYERASVDAWLDSQRRTRTREAV
jgi:prophage regulatory protein